MTTFTIRYVKGHFVMFGPLGDAGGSQGRNFRKAGTRHRTAGHRADLAQIVGAAADMIDAANIPFPAVHGVILTTLVYPRAEASRAHLEGHRRSSSGPSYVERRVECAPACLIEGARRILQEYAAPRGCRSPRGDDGLARDVDQDDRAPKAYRHPKAGQAAKSSTAATANRAKNPIAYRATCSFISLFSAPFSDAHSM